ncbi:uncharacterized protein MONBRDRAFT_13237, partial [Monosiga brevicollis MX1]
ENDRKQEGKYPKENATHGQRDRTYNPVAKHTQSVREGSSTGGGSCTSSSTLMQSFQRDLAGGRCLHSNNTCGIFFRPTHMKDLLCVRVRVNVTGEGHKKLKVTRWLPKTGTNPFFDQVDEVRHARAGQLSDTELFQNLTADCEVALQTVRPLSNRSVSVFVSSHPPVSFQNKIAFLKLQQRSLEEWHIDAKPAPTTALREQAEFVDAFAYAFYNTRERCECMLALVRQAEDNLPQRVALLPLFDAFLAAGKIHLDSEDRYYLQRAYREAPPFVQRVASRLEPAVADRMEKVLNELVKGSLKRVDPVYQFLLRASLGKPVMNSAGHKPPASTPIATDEDAQVLITVCRDDQ